MIFHLLAHLQATFPGMDIIAEGELSGDPQERIVIQAEGGPVQGYPLDRRDEVVRVRVYRQDQFECRHVACRIFDHLRERHGVTWDPHAMDVSGTESLRVARVAAMHSPQPLGRLEADGVFLYAFRIVVTYSG